MHRALSIVSARRGVFRRRHTMRLETPARANARLASHSGDPIWCVCVCVCSNVRAHECAHRCVSHMSDPQHRTGARMFD